jgi:transcription elongation factor Elf1
MRKENPSEYGKKGMKEMIAPQYEEWYCPNCGTAQKKNTTVNKKTGDRQLTCNDCEIVIRFYIISAAKKIVAEAAKSFDATPMTDRQSTGRANTGKSKRKRKK